MRKRPTTIGAVIAVLDDKRRVVADRGGIQWMLQVRAGTGWRSRSFCQTREALLRCCGGEQHPALLALPSRIGEPVAVEPTTDSMQEAAE
jgi:hypothetical protein